MRNHPMGVLVTGILHFLLPAGNLRNPAAQHHRGARDVKCIKAKGIAGTEQERQASKGLPGPGLLLP